MLYFGQAPFWSALRARGGDPTADLEVPGPQLVGRFDLRRRKLLPPLDVTAPGARSGVWDVYAHPNGRVYYTTYFEAMGWVDPATGEGRRLDHLGPGLNEIAPGPRETLLVSRYASAGGGGGSVLAITPEGEPVAEHLLAPPPGFLVAPKTVAFDPIHQEIWVTTDLLAEAGEEVRHDAYVLDADGREKRRIQQPELHFVAFGADGSGFRAEVEGSRLWLHTHPVDGAGERHLLDESFAPDLDFVQDLHVTADGRAVLTRWSGFVHVVEAGGAARTLRLPALEPGGLYYSSALAGEGVCATYCAGVSVVCQSLPGGRLR